MSSEPEPGNGVKVRPDAQTKTVGGAAYGFAMAAILFLAVQVWESNGKMERLIAQNELQQLWNMRMERMVELLARKVDALAERVNGKD